MICYAMLSYAMGLYFAMLCYAIPYTTGQQVATNLSISSVATSVLKSGLFKLEFLDLLQLVEKTCSTAVDNKF